MKQISKFILLCVFLQITTAAIIGHDDYTFKSIQVLRESTIDEYSYEQYTLGQVEDGAQIIFMNESTQTFDDKQPEISLNFSYPVEGSYDVDETQNLPIITQIQLYVKTNTGASTQAYVIAGGINENNINLRIISNNANLLNYMVVVYGKKSTN